MKTLSRSLILLFVFLPFAFSEGNNYPQRLRMKGRFTDTRVPLTDTLSVRFSIWDSPSGYGNLLWQDSQDVTVRENAFQVVLGQTQPLPPGVFTGGDRWVEIQIGDDAPMRPRHKIPSREIQAQVAAGRAVAVAPPPVAPPVPVTPPPPVVSEQERRELELQFEQDRVAVTRQAPKPPVKAKPVPPSSTGGEQGPTYEVKAGDTLKSIAQKMYGNAELWYDIYYLNRDRLGPMGHLFPGQLLVLPVQGSGARTR